MGSRRLNAASHVSAKKRRRCDIRAHMSPTKKKSRAEDNDVLRGNTSRRAKLGHSVNVKDLPHKEKGLGKWIVQKDPS